MEDIGELEEVFEIDDELSPEKVIKPEYLEEYESGVKHIWQNGLVGLNTNLFILRKLIDFPFDIFFLASEIVFWNLTMARLYESSILIIYHLVLDQDKRTFHLGNLRDEIFAKYCKESSKEMVTLRMKEINSDSALTNELKNRILFYRNNYIGHLKSEKDFNQWINEKHKGYVTISELEQIRDTLNRHFGELCFGIGYKELPIFYCKPEYSYKDRKTGRQILI